MKKSVLLAALLVSVVLTPVEAQLEFVADGSSQLVTSIPDPSGPGMLGYYIPTEYIGVGTSNIGFNTAGTLADFAPDSYSTTGGSFSTLQIGGTSYQTANYQVISTTDSAVLATITLGSSVPSSFQLGFLADNSDGIASGNTTTLTLSSTGSTSVTITAYNLAQNSGVNDFYYVDVSHATPGEVITISGTSAQSSQQSGGGNIYDMAISGITFDSTSSTYIWTGAGDGTFDNSQGTSTPSNWIGGTTYPGANDTAGFDTSSKTAVTFTGNDGVNTLVFGVNGANASSYTFASGHTLTIGNNLFVNSGVSAATETFNNAISFSNGATIVNQGSDTTLNFSAISGSTSGIILQGGQAYGSEAAGDRLMNFTGSISGSGGITANLNGAVANFQTTNSYTGTTILNSGVLEYTGSAASGTPFGTGSVVINGGKLLIAPTGIGAHALTGATASGATFSYGTSGPFGSSGMYGPNGTLQLTAPTGGSVTYTIGSGSGSVFAAEGYSSTLIIESSTSATLGTTENLVVNGTAPTLTNGIVGTNVIGENATNGYGSYLTYGAIGTTGFSDYISGTPLIGTTTTSGSATTNYTVGSTGWTNNSTGSFSANTLTITGGTVSGNTLNSGGLILNNATVNNTISSTEYIYVAGNSVLNGTNSGQDAVNILGPGTLTINAAQNSVTNYYLGGPGAVSIQNAGEISSGASNTSPAYLVFDGGTLDTTGTLALDAANGAGTDATSIYINAGGATFDTAANTTLAITSAISTIGDSNSVPFALDKTDAGTLISTGNNTFNGALTIGAVDYQTRDAAVANPSTTVGGTMLLTGSNQFTITTVAGNGTIGSSVLGGTGSITATNNTANISSGIFVQNGGVLAPGIINPNSTSGLTGLSATARSSAAVGTFTFTGAGTTQSEVNLTNGGNFLWTLGNEKDNSTGTAGTDFSQLVLTGNTLLQLGGTSSLTINFLSGISSTDAFWQSDHAWQIINDTSGATSDGTTFASITDANYGDGSFTVVSDNSGEELLYTEAVPEPSTFALFGLSFLGLGFLAWRKSKLSLDQA